MGKPVKNEENYKFEINNLNLHYGDFHALKNINMNIEKNQITAFIGPSGCGKSTFLKTLNRMNDLVDGVKIDGNVYLDGKDIFADMDAINLRHRVGMVFQKPNPFEMTVYDNVASSGTMRCTLLAAGELTGSFFTSFFFPNTIHSPPKKINISDSVSVNKTILPLST